MQKPLKEFIQKLIPQQRHQEITFNSVGGGSINEAWQISTGNKTFFCKINSANTYPALFEKEAAGLKALEAANCIRTPGVIGVYEWQGYQVLLLEWIEEGRRTAAFWKTFGQQLAKLHSWKDAAESNAFFGWKENNYMGSLPQENTMMNDWCDFFREKRLMPQIQLASTKGYITSGMMREFDKAFDKLNDIFEPTSPCLLHGDLWSGNFLCSKAEEPVLIDPAVYYGHPAIDLAMTTLFGGFDASFYEAYHHWRPFPANHREQWQVCNLYPLLIHLNLFGSSYLSSIASTLRRFQ